METTQHREPWNKGKLVGQKPPLKPNGIWAIRIHPPMPTNAPPIRRRRPPAPPLCAVSRRH